MSDQARRILLERYADGLKLCNCRSAYYGKGWAWKAGKRFISHCCPSGCSSNQIQATEYVARRMSAELGLQPAYVPTERVWDRDPKDDGDEF